MERFVLIVFSIVCFLFVFSPVFAVAPIISNAPTTADLDTQFSITLTMSGLSNNAIYRLRLVFAPPGTSNYFGSTFNNTDWYNGTPSPINYSNFLSITTDNSGTWSGSVQGKIESSDSNLPSLSGTYDLKVGRYTETGTSATWSNIVQVTLVLPTPTPTPTDTPTPTPTPTSSPTSTPIPTKTPTPTPTKKLTITPTKIPSNQPASTQIQDSQDNKVTLPQSILGTSSAGYVNPSPISTQTENNNFSFKNLLFIAGGIILILAGGLIFTFVAKDRFKKI